MPFIRADEDGLDIADDDSVNYTGPFTYYPPAEVAYKPKPFDPAALSAAAAAAYGMLRAIGVTAFRVRYDGGHDEGFAHADAGRTADGVDRPLAQLATELASSDRVDALRAALGQGAAGLPPAASAYYAKLTPGELVARALDELADEAVACLLGRGYGTGEYSMYGAVTIDLTSGTLSDEPSVPRPPDATFD